MQDFIADTLASSEVELDCAPAADGRYTCTLRGPRGRLQRLIRVREGVGRAPTAGQLLYRYALEAQPVRDSDGFEDWAEELDLDPSDPATRARHGEALQLVEDLVRLLGRETYESMMAGLEIHQAISAAVPPDWDLE